MTAATCARCAKPMPHDQAVACAECGTHLRGLLARTARLAGDPEITIARLDNVRRGQPQPDEGDDGWWRGTDALEPMNLPVNFHAADAYRTALGELGTWARHIQETRGLALVADSWAKFAMPIWDRQPWWSEEQPPNALTIACAEIAGSVDWLRHRSEADEAFSKIEDACRQIARIVDNRDPGTLVGICWDPHEPTDNDPRTETPTWLYAHTGAQTVACDACGRSYEVRGSRDRLRDALRDRLMTGAQIADAAILLELAKKRDAVRRSIINWAQRGRIIPKSHIGPDPAYTFEDVLPLIIDAYTRAAA